MINESTLKVQRVVRRALILVGLMVTPLQASENEAAGNADISLHAGSDIINIVDFGALPDDGLSDDDAVRRAMTVALRQGGVLYFPAGDWHLLKTLMLTCVPEGPGRPCTGPGLSQPIQIRGANIRATRIFSSASPAISMQQGHQPISTLLQDFRLTGSLHGDSPEQHGIDFCDNTATAALTIERVQVDGFNGDGICARAAYNARIVHNRLESVRTGIRCEECRISVIESNRVSTFSRTGIFVGTNSDNASSNGSVAVRIVANEITHSRAFDGKACETTVTGIRIGRGQAVTVESNYFEDVQAPPECGAVADTVGIAVKPENGVTRDTIIKANYWSGRNGPRAIYIDAAAHFSVLDATGGGDRIVDNGLNTAYLFHRIGGGPCTDPAAIAGTSTTRRGWVVRSGWYHLPNPPSQLQDCGSRSNRVSNPVFQLHSNTDFE